MNYTVKDGEVAEFKGRNYTAGKTFEHKSDEKKDIHILKKVKKSKTKPASGGRNVTDK